MTVRQISQSIKHVIVYKGHEKNPLCGPYHESVRKNIEMFTLLNHYREEKPKWEVTSVSGENLIQEMGSIDPETTLLVIPAGPSASMDKVFSKQQTTFLKTHFFEKGGRGSFTCGSSYWVSEKRVYTDLCQQSPLEKIPITTDSQFPLFEGISVGPLCPYPGKEYKVGFFSDAVGVTDGTSQCKIYLSGGGSFCQNSTSQKVKVLVKYLPSELHRLGKLPEGSCALENAAIMVSIGKGAALLSMFHPYHSSNDIDVELYNKYFPNSGTNWQVVKETLSPLDLRMQFVLKSMLTPLEEGSWE